MNVVLVHEVGLPNVGPAGLTCQVHEVGFPLVVAFSVTLADDGFVGKLNETFAVVPAAPACGVKFATTAAS